jgi:trafficking protein particle complex subunit 8
MSILSAHPHIPPRFHPSIFPIFSPSSVDFVVFWEIPSQGRVGHCLVAGPALGARHALLRELLGKAASAKPKRNMYAETQRERVEMLEAIRVSEWNAEMDPLAVISHSGQQIKHDFSTGWVDSTSWLLLPSSYIRCLVQAVSIERQAHVAKHVLDKSYPVYIQA